MNGDLWLHDTLAQVHSMVTTASSSYTFWMEPVAIFFPLPLSISFLHSIPDPVFSLSPIPINPGHSDSSSLLLLSTAPLPALEKGMSTITMKVAYILEQARPPPGLPLGQCLLRWLEGC